MSRVIKYFSYKFKLISKKGALWKKNLSFQLFKQIQNKQQHSAVRSDRILQVSIAFILPLCSREIKLITCQIYQNNNKAFNLSLIIVEQYSVSADIQKYPQQLHNPQAQ
ncbi:hypothetical protein ABPG72_002700 [Tetrahymena utriculariae]